MVKDIIVSVVELLLVFGCFLIGKFVIPTIKASKGYEALQEFRDWVETYTKGVEQITIEKGAGEEKLAKVLELASVKANELGIKISENDIKMTIESCVKAMNEGEKTTIKVDGN